MCRSLIELFVFTYTFILYLLLTDISLLTQKQEVHESKSEQSTVTAPAQAPGNVIGTVVGQVAGQVTSVVEVSTTPRPVATVKAEPQNSATQQPQQSQPQQPIQQVHHHPHSHHHHIHAVVSSCLLCSDFFKY